MGKGTVSFSMLCLQMLNCVSLDAGSLKATILMNF